MPDIVARDQPPVLNRFGLAVEVGGTWLDLNDKLVYTAGAECFGSQALQYRRVEATSPYVGGRYLVNAVPDNVQETLVVWVKGSDWFEIQQDIYGLIQAFSQFSYRVRRDFEMAREIWNCFPADYSINYDRVFVHNHMAQIRFQIPRLPQVVSEVAM